MNISVFFFFSMFITFIAADTPSPSFVELPV